MIRRLHDLLHDVPDARLLGDADPAIRDVVYDSRRARPGSLFVAIPGLKDDGAKYTSAAVSAGATAVAVESAIDGLGVPQIVVPDARRALAQLAAAHAGHPSRQMLLIGVTGTDGKTTTSTLTARIFEAHGAPTGLMTTVEMRVCGRPLPNPFHHTTPAAPEVQRTLARMLRAGAGVAVLETSSHALALDRVTGCAYDVAVITNLNREHLDFHKTFDEYRAAKGQLFEMLGQDNGKGFRRFGVVNADDSSADYFRKHCPVEVLTYGVEHEADLRARDVRLEPGRTVFTVDSPWGTRELETRLIGRFNVSNWLAASAVALGQGLPWSAIERAAAEVEPPRGRVQLVDEGQPFAVLVDFAHTPQALSAVLESARAMTRGRVIVVLGHAGERDAGNRPRMGSIARRGADVAIVTTDDPYREDPQAIIDQILEGAKRTRGDGDVVAILDRKHAIRTALHLAREGDVVVIAGRGHERFTTVGTRRIPLDDARVAREALRRLYGERELAEAG